MGRAGHGKSCPKGRELPKLYSGTFQRLATPVSLVILDPTLGEKEIYSKILRKSAW